MIYKDDILLLSQKLPFWKHLTQQQRDGLVKHTKNIHYSKGQDIHSSSDCMGVIIVKSGTIRVYITSEEGREITLFRLNEGDTCIFTASCVLKSITFDIFLEAEVDCSLLQIQPVFFERLTHQNVYAELFSYKLASERFSEIMWAMQQILFTRFDKRLATFLLEESAQNNSDTIYMTHEQIAKYLSSAREVVSRMLKYFANEGYVTLSRGGITIINKNKLRTI